MLVERTAQQKARSAARQRRRVSLRLAQGVCIDCGDPYPVIVTLKVRLCVKCRDGRTRRAKASIKARKAAALCCTCGEPSKLTAICPKCIQARTEANRQMRRRTRLFVVAALGGRCIDCGESDIRVMTLDHVNGDGAEHRREQGDSSRRIWRDVEKQIITLGESTRKVVLRCYNCHFKKDLKLWWFTGDGARVTNTQGWSSSN